ncbi:MAG: phosphoribosyl-ATP diphosphatase [Spirochaetes bacterium]|jgi:phosphoribosyl-ATP pyrophosphohydrolase|nr:phosphoribosyl-ATP diphosphatase [Spirochaetota bacterium]
MSENIAGNSVFDRLFEVIDSRREESPDKSYVARLMHRGIDKINSKIIEEAAEVTEAAHEEDREHLIYEICDLLFHTFVLAGYRNITLAEIEAELIRRFGKSGLVEKAERKNNAE